jgi:hypothetical protein
MYVCVCVCVCGRGGAGLRRICGTNIALASCTNQSIILTERAIAITNPRHFADAESTRLEHVQATNAAGGLVDGVAEGRCGAVGPIPVHVMLELFLPDAGV